MKLAHTPMRPGYGSSCSLTTSGWNSAAGGLGMSVCSLQASPVLRALRLTASCRQNGAWWSMKIRRLSCRLPGPLGGGVRGRWPSSGRCLLASPPREVSAPWGDTPRPSPCWRRRALRDQPDLCSAGTSGGRVHRALASDRELDRVTGLSWSTCGRTAPGESLSQPQLKRCMRSAPGGGEVRGLPSGGEHPAREEMGGTPRPCYLTGCRTASC